MITESIYSNSEYVIPMAEVSHILREHSGIWVIFKYSKNNPESKFKNKMEPSIWLSYPNTFLKDWCRYRNELELIPEFNPAN